MNITLLEKQFIFSRLHPKLNLKINESGYEISEGEMWRTEEQAKWNAEHGLGICNSDHRNRLATDKIIWKDGKECLSIDDYRLFGEYWKSLSSDNYLCCWGGDFKDEKGSPKPDIFHFSIEHNGIR